MNIRKSYMRTVGWRIIIWKEIIAVIDANFAVVERNKLTAKTVDEDPASCKRWISREEIKSAKI